ncbi:MAG: 23S rRNA (adenine(2503)-C(2))-methyltransferase RlmN, partial [Lentisphaeria bacterium]
KSYSLDADSKRIPIEIMQLAKDHLQTRFLTLEKIVNSQIDGATKLLFKTHDDFFIEAVILRITTGRISICISSQCGCKFKCAFCATGCMGFKRNLSSDEIIDQIVQASFLLLNENASLRNIVFMGMGEPLDNYNHVCNAIKVLAAPTGFNFSLNNIMLSTCGLMTKLLDFATTFPSVNLAISLHSAEKLQRNLIMPINHSNDLDSIRNTILQINAITAKPIMLEYLLLKNINDSGAAIDALINFCQQLNVRINLIAYNPHNNPKLHPFEAVDNQKIRDIRNYLSAANLEVTIRYSLGQDIDAACGQLAIKSE